MLEQIIGLILTFFLPGITFVYMLFPRKGEMDPEYDFLYRLTFGILMSVAILVIFGFLLNALGTSEATGLGYVTDVNLWLGLSIMTVVFFVFGWWRGAYPWLGKLHKSLLRLPRSPPHSVLSELDDDKVILARFKELAEERERLRRELKDIDRRIKLQTGSLKEHYLKKKTEVQESLKEVDEKLRKLEEERATQLYMS